MSLLKFVPQELHRQQIVCPKCGKSFSPDWLKPLKFPNGTVPGDGGFWVCYTADVDCPNCDVTVVIRLPVNERKGVVKLFGDEATRNLLGESVLYTYSVVGTSEPLMAKVERAIWDLKSRLLPEVSPSDWKIHMKIIWSGDQRKKINIFSSWTSSTTQDLFAGLKDIFCDSNNNLFKFNIVFIGQNNSGKIRMSLEEYVRNEVYTALVPFIIDNVTKSWGQPLFFFDSQKNTKADHAIHKWASDAFDNGQKTLLYSFISHGIYVPEPKFVKPASMPILELADVMSFLVARYHYLKGTGKKMDVDLATLGKTTYITMKQDTNDLLHKYSIGYPWSINYPS